MVAVMMALSTVVVWPGSFVAQDACDETVEPGDIFQDALDAAAES